MSELDEEQQRVHAAREALIGASVAGRYVLRALIGHGGMGAVYEAEHLGLGKRVAIKFIDQSFATDERVLARFAREARAMSAIESAHIVTVFDAGTEGGRPYLVMELLRGEDLGQRLRRSRRIPLAEAMHVVAQVLKGLAKAHGAGIVHRDLKPDNVFIVRSDTDPSFAKIVDFGVSKIERPRDGTSPLALTGRGTVLGTPLYMCPEQAQAKPDVDGRADLYSVGAILFECLTGRPPHTGETYEQVILSICMTDAPDVRAIEPRLPPEVAAFVARALARDRAERFASAERMLAVLHEIAPEERLRVPLDAGPEQTLLSAGAPGPASGAVPPRARESPAARAPAFERTRIAGSGASSTPDPAPRVHGRAALSGALDGRVAPVARPRRRATLSVVATAVAATLFGIVVMLGIIGVLGRLRRHCLGRRRLRRRPIHRRHRRSRRRQGLRLVRERAVRRSRPRRRSTSRETCLEPPRHVSCASFGPRRARAHRRVVRRDARHGLAGRPGRRGGRAGAFPAGHRAVRREAVRGGSVRVPGCVSRQAIGGHQAEHRALAARARSAPGGGDGARRGARRGEGHAQAGDARGDRA
jgi:serine/threonine-protein kinase